MKYPMNVCRKHNNIGSRRKINGGATHLRLYGLNSKLEFQTERISRTAAFMYNHFPGPQLYSYFRIECDSCLKTSMILAKKLPGSWNCDRCRHLETETEFN